MQPPADERRQSLAQLKCHIGVAFIGPRPQELIRYDLVFDTDFLQVLHEIAPIRPFDNYVIHLDSAFPAIEVPRRAPPEFVDRIEALVVNSEG